MKAEFGETADGKSTHLVGVREEFEMAFSFCGRYLPMTYPVDRAIDSETDFEGFCKRCRAAFLRLPKPSNPSYEKGSAHFQGPCWSGILILDESERETT